VLSPTNAYQDKAAGARAVVANSMPLSRQASGPSILILTKRAVPQVRHALSAWRVARPWPGVPNPCLSQRIRTGSGRRSGRIGRSSRACGGTNPWHPRPMKLTQLNLCARSVGDSSARHAALAVIPLLLILVLPNEHVGINCRQARRSRPGCAAKLSHCRKNNARQTS